MNQTLPAVAVRLYSLRHLLHDLRNLVPALRPRASRPWSWPLEFDVLEPAELASLFQDHGVSVSKAPWSRPGRTVGSTRASSTGVQAVGSEHGDLVPTCHRRGSRTSPACGGRRTTWRSSLIRSPGAGTTLGYNLLGLGLLDGRPALLEPLERTDPQRRGRGRHLLGEGGRRWIPRS